MEWFSKTIPVPIWIFIIMVIYVAVHHGYVTIKLADKLAKSGSPSFVISRWLRRRLTPAEKQNQRVNNQINNTNNNHSALVVSQPSQCEIAHDTDDKSQDERANRPSDKILHASNSSTGENSGQPKTNLTYQPKMIHYLSADSPS